MMYIIRKAVPTDEKKIRELFLEMLQTIYHTKDATGYNDGYLDRFWTGNENIIYVAEDREVVGFLSVEVHHEQEAYIYLDDFSVTAAYRYKGIGSALLYAAESYAREINIPRIFLHVEKINPSAMHLYEKSGYTINRDDGDRFLMNKAL